MSISWIPMREGWIVVANARLTAQMFVSDSIFKLASTDAFDVGHCLGLNPRGSCL